MKFNEHKEYEGKHAFLGASSYHWLNWDDITFENRYYSQFSTIIGTTMHALAHDCIVSKTRLNKHDVHLVEMYMYKAFVPRDAYDPVEILETLVPFVNDAIGFRMQSEIILFYNRYCFGTTDAIRFDEKEMLLRISDYKSGSTPAKMEQLYIYCALFCMEYKFNPYKLRYNCKIYQSGQIIEDEPDSEIIASIIENATNKTSTIGLFLEREGR